jgi:hypothetical protein
MSTPYDENEGQVLMPPRGMGYYLDEQEEARLQAMYRMGKEAETWSEMENSSLLRGPRQSPAWLPANHSQVQYQYAP